MNSSIQLESSCLFQWSDLRIELTSEKCDAYNRPNSSIQQVFIECLLCARDALSARSNGPSLRGTHNGETEGYLH